MSDTNMTWSGDGNGYMAHGANERLYVIGRTPGRKFRITVLGDAGDDIPKEVGKVMSLAKAQIACEEHERVQVWSEREEKMNSPRSSTQPLTPEAIDIPDVIELGDGEADVTDSACVPSDLPSPTVPPGGAPKELSPEQERVLDNLDKEFRSSCKPVGRTIPPPRKVLGYALKHKRHGEFFKDFARDPRTLRVNDNAATFTPDERGALLSSSEFAAHALVSGVMYPAHWKVVAVKG